MFQFLQDLRRFQGLNVAKGLVCSFLSIIIYLIIALVIAGFAQGNVIPLDIYIGESAIQTVVNLSIFHFLLYFLAMIMSLYPTYIYVLFFENLNEFFFASERWGLIYYSRKTTNDKYEINPLRFIEGAVRKLLAVGLFIFWSWLIVYVYCVHQIETTKVYPIIIFNIFCTFFYLYMFWFFTVRVKSKMYFRNNNTKGKINKHSENQLNKLLTTYESRAKIYYKYYVLFFLTLLFLLCLIAACFEWSSIVIITQLGTCLLISIHLIIYRTFRKLSLVISNIGNYLSLHRWFGLAVLSFLICVNLSIDIAEYINPINIILAGLITFYTLAILLIKIYLFLRCKNTNGQHNYIPFFGLKIKLRTYLIIVTTLVSFCLFNSINGNKLHQLLLVDNNTTDHVTLESFYKKYAGFRSTKSPILYAAYGGGLKAHYWNFMILDELNNYNTFNDIIAMSGLSGGGMGIGNYLASEYQIAKGIKIDKTKVINTVKKSNILSIELAWLFGLDLIRNMIPNSTFFGLDRSHRSMEYYGDILGSHALVDDLSFQHVYKSVYDIKYYPNIIINSTSTRDKYGVISAIIADDVFPGAINLLNINQNGQDKTLTYFEALSTCNRFPLISPAANVPTKGYFVDGGYFENSGVLSLISFKKAIDIISKPIDSLYQKSNPADSTFTPFYKRKIKLVSVRNGKLNYLQSLIEHRKINITETFPVMEMKSIITGISDLERMPNYIRSQLELYHKDEFEMIYIDLPYYIDTAKIDKYFGGKLELTIHNEICMLVQQSNNEIIHILKSEKWHAYKYSYWGIVNPPTARILSKPVELYMEAMMEHPNVRKQIGKIFSIDFK